MTGVLTHPLEIGPKKGRARQSEVDSAGGYNRHPDYLNRKIREACGLRPDKTVQWVSPLREDEYAEYRDEQFLARLQLHLNGRPLKSFWPRLGPQWDALGRTNRGTVILVEAKANLPELVSPGTKATQKSRVFIQNSLREVQDFLKVDTDIDWSGKLYQYTNRIAHLYLLRQLNRVDARLVFVYFVGANEVEGPGTIQEWQAASLVAKRVLGLDKHHRLSNYINDVFIDVGHLDVGDLQMDV